MGIVMDDNGQFRDEYMTFMDAEIMPTLRILFDKQVAYLKAHDASPLDFYMMLEYAKGDMELSANSAYLERVEWGFAFEKKGDKDATVE